MMSVTRKLVSWLPCGIVCVKIFLAILTEHHVVTDSQTDRHTATDTLQ